MSWAAWRRSAVGSISTAQKKGAPAEAGAPEGIQQNASEGQKVTVVSFEQVEVPASHTW